MDFSNRSGCFTVRRDAAIERLRSRMRVALMMIALVGIVGGMLCASTAYAFMRPLLRVMAVFGGQQS